MINSDKYKNLYFDYLIGSNVSDVKTIVLLEGLPTTSRKDKLIFDLNKLGYDVFYPNYEGTRSSTGVFLERSPVDPINEFLSALASGLVIGKYKYKTNNIFILSSSFGGGISLTLNDSEYVNKVIALSPVLSFKNVKGIETLEEYISNNLSQFYRYKKDNWQKMLADEYFCALTNTKISNKKILIMAGVKDTEISIEQIIDYCANMKIKLVSYHDKPHLTFSKIDELMLNEINNFFIK